MLSSIIGLAAAEPERGLLYMFIYILGFSVPFFLFALFFTMFRRIHRYTSMIMKTGGMVMMGIGLLLITGKLAYVSAYLNNLFNFTGYL